VRAPDFTYEVPGEGQQALLQRNVATLVVLYSLPASRERLLALAADPRVARADLRVITVALDSAEPARADPTLARASREDRSVGSVYAMFARSSDAQRPAHAELLLDASGRLRARWLGLPQSSDDRTAAELAEASELARAPMSAPSSHHHAH
jgi:hypothetical protein